MGSCDDDSMTHTFWNLCYYDETEQHSNVLKKKTLNKGDFEFYFEFHRRVVSVTKG